MPPPLLVSMASNNLTTSSMSGRLSGFPSQHFRMMLANELGQHLGISGRKFCILSSIGSHIRDDKKTNSHKFNLAWALWYQHEKSTKVYWSKIEQNQDSSVDISRLVLHKYAMFNGGMLTNSLNKNLTWVQCFRKNGP